MERKTVERRDGDGNYPRRRAVFRRRERRITGEQAETGEDNRKRLRGKFGRMFKNRRGMGEDMSKLDLLKLMQAYEGEVEIADFTPQELEDLLARLNDDDISSSDGKPLTKEEFKKKYFDFYDDVKDPSLKKQDW